jgi:hypothetical protein
MVLLGTNLRIYEFTNLRIYEFTNLRIYEFTNLRIYEFTNLRIYEFTNLRIHEFTNFGAFSKFSNMKNRLIWVERLVSSLPHKCGLNITNVGLGGARGNA